MESTNDVKIIAFVGMPGAGKSSAVDYISQRGYPTVYFGGVVLQAIKDAGLPVTPANEKRMRQQLRQDEGKDVIVKRITQQIRQLIAKGHSRIVADGLYSWTEYTYLQRAFPGQLYGMACATSAWPSAQSAHSPRPKPWTATTPKSKTSKRAALSPLPTTTL